MGTNVLSACSGGLSKTVVLMYGKFTWFDQSDSKVGQKISDDWLLSQALLKLTQTVAQC